MEDNIIVIGQKDLGNYVRSVEFFFKKQNKSSVVLKARGMNIKKAVDIAQTSKNKFLKDLNLIIGEIEISTATFEDSNEVERSVSCIDITLKK